MKLVEINNTLTDILREEVLRDTGSSKLKQKVLDVISKLRVEAKVVETYQKQLRDRVMKKSK